jgi:hypothetical protein
MQEQFSGSPARREERRTITGYAMLRRQGVIDTWHDRQIGAGQEIDVAIDARMEAANIILLLVSPDFIASDYCYEREMTRAMQRHEIHEAIVIPVILRACDWQGTPFRKLLVTPKDGRPVTQWPDRDQAFLEVAKAIRGATERLQEKKVGTSKGAPAYPATVENVPRAAAPVLRSSNLRLAKQFTERDRDAFKLDTFDYIAHYFENSLNELQTRNRGIEGTFRRIDSNRFSAVVYRDGKAIARCTVFMGGRHFIDGIAYSSNETTDSNSFNESLSVEADDQMLYFRSMGMAHLRGRPEVQKLSQEGAAELYWGIFIEPLQRR